MEASLLSKQARSVLAKNLEHLPEHLPTKLIYLEGEQEPCAQQVTSLAELHNTLAGEYYSSWKLLWGCLLH